MSMRNGANAGRRSMKGVLLIGRIYSIYNSTPHHKSDSKAQFTLPRIENEKFM